jgi:hypothetical protein
MVSKAESVAKSSINRGIGRTLSIGFNVGIPSSLSDDAGGIGAKEKTSLKKWSVSLLMGTKENAYLLRHRKQGLSGCHHQPHTECHHKKCAQQRRDWQCMLGRAKNIEMRP